MTSKLSRVSERQHGKVENMGFEVLFLDLSPGSTPSWVALGKSLNLSDLRFPMMNGTDEMVGLQRGVLVIT